MEEELFYEVLFDQDCTVCYNLPPSDLLVCGLSVCMYVSHLDTCTYQSDLSTSINRPRMHRRAVQYRSNGVMIRSMPLNY